MSFNADHLMAARNLTYPKLNPDNPTHESAAEEMILTALEDDLGEAFDRLVHIANEVRGADGPIDECLHCWINGTNKTFTPYTGKTSFVAFDADQPHPLILSMRRIAMFDVPRRLFAREYGVWVYWLFNNVFVFSPTEEVDMEWAFARHAYRHEWGATGKKPTTSYAIGEARSYVLNVLHSTASAGLERIKDGLARAHDNGIDNVPVKGPLFEPVCAWMGSLTGGELLKGELGYENRLVTYNCCGAAAPQDQTLNYIPPKKASAVKQLQNQSPDKRDC